MEKRATAAETRQALGAGKGIAEFLLWVWVVALLLYFYYSQGFLELLSYLWKKFVG